MSSNSSKRDLDFRNLFREFLANPDEETVVDDYSCALQKDILIHGRMYITNNYICFYSNLFSFITQEVIQMSEIIAVEKKFTALIIPNAILVSTLHQKYFFTSFLAREQAYGNIIQIWKEYQRRPLKEALKKSETVFSDDEEEYLHFVDPETKRLISRKDRNCLILEKNCQEIILDQTYDSPLTRLKNVLFGKILDPFTDYLFPSSSPVVKFIKVGDWKKSFKDDLPDRDLKYQILFGNHLLFISETQKYSERKKSQLEVVCNLKVEVPQFPCILPFSIVYKFIKLKHSKTKLVMELNIKPVAENNFMISKLIEDIKIEIFAMIRGYDFLIRSTLKLPLPKPQSKETTNTQIFCSIAFSAVSIILLYHIYISYKKTEHEKRAGSETFNHQLSDIENQARLELLNVKNLIKELRNLLPTLINSIY